MRERREAAAKLASNHEAVVKRLAARAGVMHQPGSMYGMGWQDINGVWPLAPASLTINATCVPLP
jgi:hypothetical protein